MGTVVGVDTVQKIRMVCRGEPKEKSEEEDSSEVQDSQNAQDGVSTSVKTLLPMIPKAYAYKANAILIHVLNDPKRTLNWNGFSKLLYGDKEIEGSDVVDLLKDSQR